MASIHVGDKLIFLWWSDLVFVELSGTSISLQVCSIALSYMLALCVLELACLLADLHYKVQYCPRNLTSCANLYTPEDGCSTMCRLCPVAQHVGCAQLYTLEDGYSTTCRLCPVMQHVGCVQLYTPEDGCSTTCRLCTVA